MCLITQDVGLAYDILDLNKSRSAEFNKFGKRMIKDIKAIKINGEDSCEEFSTQKKNQLYPKRVLIEKNAYQTFKKSIKNIDITTSKVLATIHNSRH